MCSRSVKLRGGFRAEIRYARKEHTCFYCRKPIRVKQQYVVLSKYGSAPECYHLECFNRVAPHRVVFMVLNGEPVLCRSPEDYSVL